MSQLIHQIAFYFHIAAGSLALFVFWLPMFSKKGDKTQLTFTHQGLVPEYECYEICDGAWKMFIGKSLSDLITTGKGQPLPKETEGYDTKMVEKWKAE